MTNVAWKNLAREKVRLGISVGGVAFAVLLILFMRGLYAGIIDQATAFIRDVDADVWVAADDTPGDFFHSVSLISEDAVPQIAAVEGVEQAAPMAGRPIVFRHEGKDLDFFLFGVDPATRTGAPPSIERGEDFPGRGELILDRVFASNSGIGIGDRVELGGMSLDVVGIARGGNTVLSQFAWTTLPDAVEILGLPGIVNYVIVATAADEPPEAVGQRIAESVPGVQAMTEAEFVDKNIADLSEGFLPIIWVLVVIALAIGSAVIGLTIYTATLEKRREYGVLKAIGFSNRQLLRIVLQQAVTAGAIGLAVGVALMFALAPAIERLVPQFVVSIRWFDLAFAAVGALLMAAVSSFVPVRRVMRLDPAQVFRV